MSVYIEKIINRPVDSNCFVIYSRVNERCIIVDPGTKDCKELVIFLESNRLCPEYIILTHEHFDHIWGVNKLKDLYGSKIICSALCSDKITNAKKNLSLFYDQVGFEVYPADITIEAINNTLKWDDITINFINTKGHSDGSISFFFDDNLFVGDLIIKGYKTITKLPGGNKDQSKESMRCIFSNFIPSKTVVYSGHGDIFTLDQIQE